MIVVGKADVGKTTFARRLYQELAADSGPVAFLDGDPGQSTLGPPCTMTVAVGGAKDGDFPPRSGTWSYFVGATSPRGHMLQILTGAARLVAVAREAGAGRIVYDTTGLIDRAQGGLTLKLAKIDLLRPDTVFALQEDGELEPLLSPLRRTKRVRVVDVSPSPARRPRDAEARRAHRARKFAQYFAGAHLHQVGWNDFPVLPQASFQPGRLLSLEDIRGLVLGLAIVEEVDNRARKAFLLTPLSSHDLAQVDALRLGEVRIDPQTFEDRALLPPWLDAGWQRGNPSRR
jgi:polynucleotide 5'-hydroxyl-kinase GRC3/NOL9